MTPIAGFSRFLRTVLHFLLCWLYADADSAVMLGVRFIEIYFGEIFEPGCSLYHLIAAVRQPALLYIKRIIHCYIKTTHYRYPGDSSPS